MRHRSVADLRSKVSTVCFEDVTSELRAVVGDDAVGYPEAAHETLGEFDRGTSWDGAGGFHFRPLGELVDGDVEVAVAPRRSRERTQDVEPLDRKRPQEWDGLEALSGLMGLLGMELIGFTRSYQFSGIVERRGPVESAAECLAHKVA